MKALWPALLTAALVLAPDAGATSICGSQFLTRPGQAALPMAAPPLTGGEILRRFEAARRRLAAGEPPAIGLAMVVSPDYRVPTFNLANAELAGYLRERNPELRPRGVELIEPDIELAGDPELDRDSGVGFTLERLRALRPHVIGLSARIGGQANLMRILDALREEPWARDAVIIVGNVLSTFSHDVLSERYPEALFALGDGELALDALYGALRSGRAADLGAVPNLAARDADGSLHVTRRAVLSHADVTWQPAFDLLDRAIERKAGITFRATTGCSACCTFCSIRELGMLTRPEGGAARSGWQSFPPERSAETFRILQEKGVTSISLADDEFGNVDFRFIERLADLLIDQGNRVRFNVSMRLDAFWKPGMPDAEVAERRRVLRKLRQAGLHSIFAGAESGSASQLSRYGKGYPVEVNVVSVRILLEEGIQPIIGFIPFDQLTNRWELEENLKYLETEVIPGHRIYEYMGSPINTMRVQRGTPYETLMRRTGLLGELQPDLTFYAAEFLDARIEAMSQRLYQWFVDIRPVRYPVIQLARIALHNDRFAPDTFARASELIREIHELDIEYTRAMAELFPVDAYDEEILAQLGESGKAAGFLRDRERLAAARSGWARAARASLPALDEVSARFRTRRDAIAARMKQLLEDAYGPTGT